MTTAIALEDLVDPEKDLEFPVAIDEFRLADPPPEAAIKNLKTMQRLGILNAEGIMALIAQAPIDPINLAGSLIKMMPTGWVFSAVDFTMMRVLSRDDRKQVDAGTLTIDTVESEETSPTRDINFDPLVLPGGISPSDDPLLSARSAAYSQSFTRREREHKEPSAISAAEVGK